MPQFDTLLTRQSGFFGRLAPTDSLGRLLTDGGPVYVETDLSHTVAEPWNAISAAVFVGIAAWWIWVLRGRYRQFGYLSLAVALLMVGGVGGTLYHAFRQSRLFLVMDWLPILLICLSASAYYFRKAVGSWRPALWLLAGLFVLQFLNFQFVPVRMAVNVSYVFMAAMVLLPTLWLLVKTRFANAGWVFAALVAFGLAISFRIYDTDSGWHQGTHFLWHTFGAIACHAMFVFTYRLNSPAFQASV